MQTFRVCVLAAGLLLTACGPTAEGPCNANTCQGCCSASGKCEAGNTAGSCGALGAVCRDCSGLGLTCTLGACSSSIPGGGGSGSTGGGGATGGGTGGGATGGGTGGGAMGGGTGGGAMGGGTGGGATGGGTGGGATGGGGGESMACAVNNGGCAAEALCTPQGTSRICTCTAGYVGDGFTCADVNECLTNNGGCGPNGTCMNSVGSHSCSCNPGYVAQGQTCVDVNECLTNNGGCSPDADCTNTMGGRTCACHAGFTGDGITCTPDAPTWAVETVAFNGGSTSALAFNTSGAPAVAYTGDSPRGVYFRTRVGTNSWSSAETVDAALNAMAPAMVRSSVMLVSNSVSNVSGATTATWRRATSWTADGSLSAQEQPSLAVGGGREHLVTNSRTSGSPSTLRYYSRAQGSTSWGSPVTVTSTASWSAPKLAVSSAGELAVLYTRNTDSSLWLARSSGTGSSWSSIQVTTARVWAFALALEAGGVASILYYLPDGHLVQLDTWAGSTRFSTQSVDAPGGVAPGSQYFSGLAIAQDSTGTLHASYLDFSRSQALRYATNGSGAFVAETVTTCGQVLGDTSIAVDSLNAPHITFPAPGSSFGNLGYAVKR